MRTHSTGTMVAVTMILAISIPFLGGCTVSERSDYNGILPIQALDGSCGGTGFVIASAPDSWFIGTAAHVVSGQSEMAVGESVGKVVAFDEINDVAILRVPRHGEKYHVFALADARLEEHVRAVGYTWSRGLDGGVDFMVYHGRVTCLTFEECVTTNSGVYPGMSGGPLLNDSGAVVGITSRAGLAWGLPMETASIFIPADRLVELWDSLRKEAE